MQRKQKQFTEEQKKELLKSLYIERVLSNHLEYSIEFKQIIPIIGISAAMDNPV